MYVTTDPLEPETIQTFELNYLGTLSSTFYVNLSLFHNMLDKLIYRTHFFVEGEYITYQANVGKMTTNGIEFKLSVIPSKKLNLEFSATYQHTKDKRTGFEDIEPGYSPRFLGYIKAYYFFTREISLAITGNYVDKMFPYYDHTLKNPDGSCGRRLGEKVDGYFLLGANLRIRDIFGTGFFINIRGSNLLDQEIRYPATSNNAGYAYRGTIGRGLSFLLTLGYQF
jgi:outer membrane receptor for ferrienterochelin and colicin